jgi:hypothetical protein
MQVASNLSYCYVKMSCMFLKYTEYIFGLNNLYIFRLGPMMTHWCMRFVAKHRYFKQLATAIGNYANLPWTLAERHQNRQCYNLCGIHKPIECGTLGVLKLCVKIVLSISMI